MKRKTDPPLPKQITSVVAIWSTSIAAGIVVFALAIFLQWLIYDDWMHRSGPLRIVGSAVAAVLTCVVAERWQVAIRLRKIEMLRRFETIKWMNDRIRNALQAIECVTYVADPEATNSVRDAVDVIEGVLQEVLMDAHPLPTTNRMTMRKLGAQIRGPGLGQAQAAREPGSRNSGNVR
jgi:hypothetical protein